MTVKTYTYYDIKAAHRCGGELEVLFGSYSKSDCEYEIEAEAGQWRDEGYRTITIVPRQTTESPDPQVYADDDDVDTDPIAISGYPTNADAIRKLIDRGAHFYCGHSGGKDSQAMYALLKNIIPDNQLHVVHADLGQVEWTGVKDHIRDNISINHPLIIAQAIHADGTTKDFFSAVRARRVALDKKGQHDAPAFPSSAARFCTSDLKTGPIWKMIRADRAQHHDRGLPNFDIVVNCVGIRGQESPARAKKIASRGTLNINSKNTNSVREAYDWWPIAHWNCSLDRNYNADTMTDDVFDEIEDAGQQPHPAYAQGNERLSCVFCIFGSVNDLQHGAKARPDLLRQYAQLESDVRGTMFNGKTLAQRIAN